MFTCIIIDDEPKARQLLQAIVQDYCPDLKLVAQCENLPDGVKAIRKQKPDLVFLDIEMPSHSGLELLDFFNEDEINFDIIFTTAYSEYAIRAFRLSAIDYLLKPIQHTQLIDAASRFKKKREKSNSSEQLKSLKLNLDASTNWSEKRIVIASAQTLHFLKPNDVIMIKGESAYSEIYLSNGNKILASRNLKHFEDMLAFIPAFMRSHKSYIINKSAILQYVKSDGGYLNMRGGLTASVSSEKIDELLESLS